MPRHGSLASQDDMAGMLDNLPRTLDEAYARVLERRTDDRYGSRLFMLVAGENRPLTTRDLRTALNITPGEAYWNGLSVILDPNSVVWRGGGGLLEIDEASDEVYWIHHSALRYLLLEEEEEDKISPHRFFFHLSDADLELARICVTYLSLGAHDRRVQVRNPRFRTDAAIDLISGSMARQTRLTKFMLSASPKKRSQPSSEIDINQVLEALRSIKVPDENAVVDFLGYSQDHWLEHSRCLLTVPRHDAAGRKCEQLFVRLFDPDVQVSETLAKRQGREYTCMGIEKRPLDGVQPFEQRRG